MRTHSSSNLPVESPPNTPNSNPKHRNRRCSKQPFILKESLVDTMANQRAMAELLRTPTEGYAEAIVVPLILAKQFELKHRAARQWLEKEPLRSILIWEDLVSKFINELFPPSRTTNLRNEISNFQQRFDESFHEAWDRYKDLLRACPHYGFTELHNTFYNALNQADQDSLNSTAGGNLLERRTQDVLIIIKKQSKFRNSRNKLVVSQVKTSDANSNSSSEIAKLTHAVNQQTSVVTTAMTAILKQFQATPPPDFVKAVEEICVTCGAAAVNYNQDNSGYRPPGSLPSNTIANPKGDLKAITTRSGIVLDGPSIPIPPPFINLKEDARVEETLTDQDLAEYTIKVPPPLVQKSKPPTQRNFYLHINITLADALILIPKYQKMLKALLSNKEKLLELANTPLNENCSTVILKKLPEKLGDHGKFLISCGFNKLKCKSLADLGSCINLMLFSVWKKLGLPELISTHMTLKLANRAICTPAGIARDVFVPVGKFTFPANFVIVDYESDPRVPLILERSFLRTARALIDVHGEEMILRDSDERLTLNMIHNTSSYSNQPQKESINLINVFNDSSKDFLKNLFSINHQSRNPTFSSHPILTSPEVKDDVFDPEGGNVLPEKFLDLDSTKDLHPPYHVSTTSSSSPNQLLEEFTYELTLITFPPGNDDLSFDIDNLVDLNDNLVDSIPEMFANEHALDYSSLPLYDEYDNDLFKVKSNTENIYYDPFDSKGEKIKESKLLIDELDLLSDLFLSFEYYSFFSEDFSKVDALPTTNNEDKVFNPGILIQENLFEIITRVAPDKKLAIFHASLILEDFDPPLYELSSFKEVPGAKNMLSFSSKNEGKAFKLGILTFGEVHSSLILEQSHQGYKIFKNNQILKSLMEIFLFSCGENIHILVVPYLHFYPP
nr:reverse transcriptase domain-containing protein [Tanacetum cinerariifolium]